MSKLEDRSISLFEKTYRDDKQAFFTPIEGTLKFSLYCKLWESRQDENKLNEERKKRMYGDEKLSKLELVIEHFGYDFGYITESVGLPIGRVLAKGTGHVFETLLSWYTFPTVGRRIHDRGGDEEGFLKVWLGLVTFTPVLYQARHEDWKYLMIPVATNMLSLIYEGYRRVKE